MKVLFAVSNENISNSIIKRYQQMYKEIISSKNVYYFNAILKELQKDKSYDRIVISEDLEPFPNNNFDTIDNFIFDKLDSISDEASNSSGEDIPIILISTDRRTKSDNLLVKLFGIGVYSTLIGQDRSIDQVCKLINKPRTKKEAKVYYQIDSGDVEYKAENENNVSEMEIQNILNHYKTLGKNEEKYAESFDNIASQYTDAQLKLIIKFLPLNVKAVLEANCPKYQQLVSFSGTANGVNKTKNNYTQYNAKPRKEDKKGIKVESILEGAVEKKPTKPVIIPSTVSTRNVKKVDKTTVNSQIDEEKLVNNDEDIFEGFEDFDLENESPKTKNIQISQNDIEESPKKGRGRPKKDKEENSVDNTSKNENTLNEETQKKRRGRPKKEEEEPKTSNVKGNKTNLFDLEDEEETTLPGFENFGFDDDDDMLLPGFGNEENDLLGVDDDDEDIFRRKSEPINNVNFKGIADSVQVSEEEDEEDIEQEENEEKEEVVEPKLSDKIPQRQETERRSAYDELVQNPVTAFTPKTENLLTKDKKIVSFVGTSKNGTSFLVNNIAELLSSQGISVAILDLTKNKNSYYIYTKNEENLRNVAFKCMENLAKGEANGIKVNKSLDVYTCLPGEENYIGQSETIIKTLVQNYSLVLIDCDFETEYEYLKESQEIYLVQSMDVLTIQPLTAFLRELKAKGILAPEKLRVVVNKTMKIRGVTERAIIGGMAFYNDPSMSFMTELFNRDTIKYTVVPFDMQVYSKYLECLVNCSITLNGYPKDFITSLRKLSGMVYPLINNKNKPSNGYNDYNNYNKF